MSTWEQLAVACPRCGAGFTAPVLKGIHITSLPEIRAQILEGRFQQHLCPTCGLRVQIESTAVYTDFDHGQYLGVEGPTSADWLAARAHHQSVFDGAFTFGPPAAQELAGGMRCRVVFGVHALREKLLLWDAGMEDLVVEAMKGDYLQARRVDVRAELLRVSAVLPGGHLLLARLSPWPIVPLDDEGISTQPMPALLGHVTFRRADYERRLRQARRIPSDYPWLADSWVRDLHVAAPPPPAAATL